MKLLTIICIFLLSGAAIAEPSPAIQDTIDDVNTLASEAVDGEERSLRVRYDSEKHAVVLDTIHYINKRYEHIHSIEIVPQQIGDAFDSVSFAVGRDDGTLALKCKEFTKCININHEVYRITEGKPKKKVEEEKYTYHSYSITKFLVPVNTTTATGLENTMNRLLELLTQKTAD